MIHSPVKHDQLIPIWLVYIDIDIDPSIHTCAAGRKAPRPVEAFAAEAMIRFTHKAMISNRFQKETTTSLVVNDRFMNLCFCNRVYESLCFFGVILILSFQPWSEQKRECILALNITGSYRQSIVILCEAAAKIKWWMGWTGVWTPRKLCQSTEGGFGWFNITVAWWLPFLDEITLLFILCIYNILPPFILCISIYINWGWSKKTWPAGSIRPAPGLMTSSQLF